MKRILKTTGIVLASATAVSAAYIDIHNNKVMKELMDAGLEKIKKQYSVEEDTCYGYDNIKMAGVLKFHVKRYTVKDLGNLCIMTVNMGVMQMATFVLTPYKKDMPMLSCDFIYTLQKRKVLIEVYDLTKNSQSEEYKKGINTLNDVVDKYCDLKDMEHENGWYDYLVSIGVYKETSSNEDERVYGLLTDLVDSYCTLAGSMDIDISQQKEKQKIIQDYCTRMVEDGGISTNMFNKTLGKEVTQDFFNKVFFGPANYE